MRKQIVRVVTSLSFFAVMCAAAHAQAAHAPLRAHVPFDFSVGGDVLPAGDYTISFVSTSTNLQTVLVRSADGRAARLVQLNSVEDAKAERLGGRLVFNRYGGAYFLSQVWEPAERTGLAMRRTRREREVEIASGAGAARATVQLANGK